MDSNKFRLFTIIMFAIILIFMCFSNDIKSLKTSSKYGFYSIILIIIVNILSTLYYSYISSRLYPKSFLHNFFINNNSSLNDINTSLSIIILSYSFHTYTFNLYEMIENKTPPKMMLSSNLGVLLSTFIYLFLSASVFIYFGQRLTIVDLAVEYSKTAFGTAVVLAFSFSVIMTFPISFFSLKNYFFYFLPYIWLFIKNPKKYLYSESDNNHKDEPLNKTKSFKRISIKTKSEIQDDNEIKKHKSKYNKIFNLVKNSFIKINPNDKELDVIDEEQERPSNCKKCNGLIINLNRIDSTTSNFHKDSVEGTEKKCTCSFSSDLGRNSDTAINNQDNNENNNCYDTQTQKSTVKIRESYDIIQQKEIADLKEEINNNFLDGILKTQGDDELENSDDENLEIIDHNEHEEDHEEDDHHDHPELSDISKFIVSLLLFASIFTICIYYTDLKYVRFLFRYYLY